MSARPRLLPLFRCLGRLACATALPAAIGCAASGPRAPRPRPLRVGPDRTALRYDDPHAATKKVLFDRINQDRVSHGVVPLRYEPRGALVGDLFCLDAALSGAWGHWDQEGRAPYHRWALAGGVDYHAQNAATYAVAPDVVNRPLAELLLESHQRMMAEQPPDDGHRRTILDETFTHVGIGLAVVGGQFRMSEEFTRVGFEWMEFPGSPLRVGDVATFRAKPLAGWEVGLVDIAYEPPPRPLSLLELKARRSYSYPPVVRTLRPRLPWGLLYHGGSRGDFERWGTTVRLRFPLSEGPGSYYVICSLRRQGRYKESVSPASAAMITATD